MKSPHLKALLACMLLYATTVFSQLPATYYQTTVQNTYNQPVDFTFTFNGTYLVVAERAGKIWVSDQQPDGTYIKRDTPILDISNQVTTYFERGVQSVVFVGTYMYLYYTVEEDYLFPNNDNGNNSATINRVSRWDLNLPNNFAVPNEQIIIGTTPSDGIPSLAGNHNGGGMVINNGFLYIATGDTASGTYTQDAIEKGILPENYIASWARYRSQSNYYANGKIYRVKVGNGDAPLSNPFYDGNPRSIKSRIWANGFRNPFRITNDTNNNLYVADVGAGQYEEISVLNQNATNCGWGLYEGFYSFGNNNANINPDTNQPYQLNQPTTFTQPSTINERIITHKLPSLVYGHTNNAVTLLPSISNEQITPIQDANAISGNSITGGCVIQGDNFGTAYNNAYIFSDFISGFLNVAFKNNNSNQRFFSHTENFAPAGSFPQTVAIKQHPEGDVYVLSINGTLTKIVYDQTLSLPEYRKFFYKYAAKQFYDLTGKQLKSLINVPNGVYLIKYTYLNRTIVEKVIKR